MDNEGQRIAAAERKFFDDNEGIDDSTNLGAPLMIHNQYIKNRLSGAFRAGWEAAKADRTGSSAGAEHG